MWTRRVALALATASVALGCGPGTELSPQAARGRASYQANCTACHSSNPALAGPLGPEVAGASRELLEARILRGEYPPGYTPKRDTSVMVALPHLEGDIDALAAYLAEAE